MHSSTPLTPKQARFVNEYSRDHNGSAAAIRAGYAPSSAGVTACRLLKKANVEAAIAANERDVEITGRMSRQRVMNGFLTSVELAVARQDTMAAIAAWREIAKMCGYYAPEKRRVEVSADLETWLAKIRELSDEELLEQVTEKTEA